MDKGKISEIFYGGENVPYCVTEEKPLYLDGVEIGSTHLNFDTTNTALAFLDFLGLDPHKKVVIDYKNCGNYLEFFESLFKKIEATINGSEKVSQESLLNAQNLKTQICLLLGETNTKTSIFDRAHLVKEWIIGFFHSLYLFLLQLVSSSVAKDSVLFPSFDINDKLSDFLNLNKTEDQEGKMRKKVKIEKLICELIKEARNKALFLITSDEEEIITRDIFNQISSQKEENGRN